MWVCGAPWRQNYDVMTRQPRHHHFAHHLDHQETED